MTTGRWSCGLARYRAAFVKTSSSDDRGDAESIGDFDEAEIFRCKFVEAANSYFVEL